MKPPRPSRPAEARSLKCFPSPWCRFLVCVLLAQPCVETLAAEICRFVGTTDHAGHVSIVTTARAAADKTVRVDVTVQFEATTALWLHLRYLVEEVSEWRNGTLLRLDANTRYLFAGHVVRQQWDEFRRTREGLRAYRIEGKRPAEFRQQYPGFAQHWDLTSFGLDWLNDFSSAAPVRRPDLDLGRSTLSAEVQPPFALAVYWVRFLRPNQQHAQVFLPGFKADKLADLSLTPVSAAPGRVWHSELHHPYLDAAPPSTATAQISADGHLRLLSFDLHGSAGSAAGTLHQAGCTGNSAQ